MPEFKFACPHCGQHIVCDVGYAGMSFNCPECKQSIVVPSTTPAASTPPVSPPPPQALGTKQRAAVPATGQRFPGAGVPPSKKSNTLKIILGATAALIVVAIGFLGVQFALHHLGVGKPKGNPAAQVASPSAVSTVQALSILNKVRVAYTNIASVKASGTLTLFLDLSNLTVADVNPNLPADAKNAKRHPAGMPRSITNTTVFSVKQAQSNLYCFTGEAVSKIDRMIMTNTFAFWSSDKGRFMFTDSHRPNSATYMQLPDINPENNPMDQIKMMQQIFADPAKLSKIVKDLGQTDDEPVNGQDCYTLTAKVLGQKVKIWVDKSTYLISQTQIIFGGTISDADIDDAFSFFANAGLGNSMQLDAIKGPIKKMAPAITKIRGTITSTTENIEINPTLTADDFNYDVPADVKLTQMPNFNRPPPRAN